MGCADLAAQAHGVAARDSNGRLVKQGNRLTPAAWLAGALAGAIGERATGPSRSVASARDASPVTLHKSTRATRRSSHRPMGPPELPEIPSSFDPALFLHSEVPDLPSSSHTDELEALRLQTRETTEAKTRQGIVIQHRAWRVPDVFRTDEDHEPGASSRSLGLRRKEFLSDGVQKHPSRSSNNCNTFRSPSQRPRAHAFRPHRLRSPPCRSCHLHHHTHRALGP